MRGVGLLRFPRLLRARTTIAAASNVAASVIRQLAEHPDVTLVTDANLARWLADPGQETGSADFREQADGAPYEAAA